LKSRLASERGPAEVVIWGAGAIGGLVGAWLARSGVDVVLVDRDEEHVEAIRARGLLIDGIRGEFRVQVPVVLPAELRGPIDLAFLCVKCLHTEAALDELVPRLSDGGRIVSLQNGLNEEAIAERVGGSRTLGCFINFGSDVLGPGHVRHGGEHPIYTGELDGTRSEFVEQVRSLLANFCETVVTDNIWGYLWSKLCYASLLFGTAMVDAPVHETVRQPEAGPVLLGLVREVIDVADAQGIRLERLADFWPDEFRDGDWRSAMERTAAHYQGQIKTRTGVWRDLAVRHRATEVDCQVGTAVSKGKSLGIEMPLNRRMLELIHQLERGDRSMSLENISALTGR
jgi:2-dehydropantoate 2-reductase